MPSYKDRTAVECGTCEMQIRVMVPTHRPDWEGNAEDWAVMLLAYHQKIVHGVRPVKETYPRWTQPCVTCGAVVADRDIERHFAWHHEKRSSNV